MNGDSFLCGWRVRSELGLPELHAWRGEDRPVDVEITLGPVNEPAGTPVLELPHSKLWADGSFLLALENVGRFRVESGKHVRVEPAPNVHEPELRTFLLGSVLGVLCHQRGLLPIHASAVRIDGRAVLIAGVSGAGKSTLAAALGARGHALIADDVAAVSPRNAGLQIMPAFPQRKLALDALEALGLEHAGLVTNRPGVPKYHVPLREGFDFSPVQPAAIYILSNAAPGRVGEFEPHSVVQSMALINRMIYRRGIGLRIQSSSAIFSAVTALAKAAPLHTLPLGPRAPLADLGKLAERLENHARALMRQ